MDLDGPYAAPRRSASSDRQKELAWVISLRIEPYDDLYAGDDDLEDERYAVEGVAVDSRARPWTKLESATAVEEEQDTGGQPGWWFLLAGRGFRPLPTTPRNSTFPSKGKKRLVLQLSYCMQSVMQVHGVFDFDKRGLPASAKIHVDRNHSQLPPAGSSSSSQSTPGLTDYLFLRTSEWKLTAIRLFVPYSVLACNRASLGSWLNSTRVTKMCGFTPGLIGVEPQPKRQKLEPSMLEPGSSGSTSRTEASTRATAAHHLKPKRRAPVKVIEITSSDDDGSDFSDHDELYQERTTKNTSGIRTMLLEDDEFEWSEQEEEETASRLKKKQPSAASTKRRSPNSRTVRSTTTTPTRPTTTTTTRSRNSLPASSLRAEKEPQSRRAARWESTLLDDDEEVSLGSEFDPDLDFDISPLAIGPTNGHPKQSVAKGKRVMDRGEESIVAPRRGRKSHETVVDEIDNEQEEDYDDEDDDDPLLQPAKPTDVFQWHSQSQGLSQVGAQPPDVEEIDSTQFVMETKNIIGSGSFARVYRANYRGIDVAVKIFKPSELQTRIDNEVRILGKLRGHPNVVQVVGYCVVNEQKQIAMEYCAYGNLHECIQNITRGLGRHGRRKTEKGQAFEATRRSTRRSRGTPVTPVSKRKRGEVEEAAPATPPDPYATIKQHRTAIIAGIARGMQHLHNNNVCHRDLSSMNVLVDSNWVPKIADFGLSTVDVGEMKGMGVGTGRWRAPEVFKNKPKNCKDQFKGFYTNSSDVYSFGVIVWELFHLGQAPWEGELDADVKRKVMQGERPKIERDVPKPWRALIEQCWTQDPDRRPSFASIINYLDVRCSGGDDEES